MSQYHYAQFGIVHVTTNAHGKRPWCTLRGVPDILIETLFLVRSLQKAKLYTFCILPTHIHLILSPGGKGLSAFMHSFKTNSSKNVNVLAANLRITATRCRSCENDDIGNAHTIRSRGIVPRNTESQSTIFTGWQKGYHDDVIRTSEQFESAIAYVQGNAGKHGLVENYAEWPWSSIHFQEYLDLVEVWTN